MIRKLAPYTKGYRIWIILGVLCSAGEAVLELLLPKAMSQIVDVGIANGDKEYILAMGLKMILMALASLVMGVGAAALAARAGMGFGANVRAAEYAQVQRFSFANIEHFSTASLITRLTNDVSSVQMTLMMGMRMLVRAPVMLITALVMALTISLQLSQVFLVVLPLLLILVIQGSVWINFSFPTILHNNLYFLAYLIVSAIMMGANIDYAIVISSRYLRLKEEMPYKEAMIEALNQAFPTVVTSGTILATAGMSIGFLSSENTVASIGVCLGRGTLLSMVLVMCVLPQILLLGDSLVEKTSFTIGLHPATQQLHGAMRVNGHVRGYINGYVDAEIHGRVNGTVSASIDIGDVQMEELPAHVAPPAQLHSEEGSDEET